MGLFDFLERTAGDSRIKKDFIGLGQTGAANDVYGKALTEEGLTGLRGLDTTYQQRLNDPLGAVGRGIFARARGALSDDAIRQGRAGQARIFQLATQSGGVLSPEAQAEINARNQRGINESMFTAEGNISTSEASMTLAETGKLFDRMEGIRKTILGVGQDERTRALEAIIKSLSFRSGRMMSIASAGTSSIVGAGK